MVDGSVKATNASSAERFVDAPYKPTMPIAITVRATPTDRMPAGKPVTDGGLAPNVSMDPGNAISRMKRIHSGSRPTPDH